MAWVVGVTSVGPLLGVDPAGKMRLRISNKQTKTKYVPCITAHRHTTIVINETVANSSVGP